MLRAEALSRVVDTRMQHRAPSTAEPKSRGATVIDATVAHMGVTATRTTR